MICKYDGTLTELHAKIDRILCLVDPNQDSLIKQARKLEKYLNTSVHADDNSLTELSEDFPMFNFYKGGNKLTVTVKGDHYA